jgi:oligopeptide transport system ATP-binding protein
MSSRNRDHSNIENETQVLIDNDEAQVLNNDNIDALEDEESGELEDYKINAKVKTKQELRDQNIILSVRNLKQFFFFGSGPSRTKLKAVNNVSFDVKEGECFGLVGESGCGKTTTGRSIIRLYDITSGSIYYKGYRISAGDRWNRKEIKYTKIRLNQAKKQYKLDAIAKIEKLDKNQSNYSDLVKEIKDERDSKINEKELEAYKIINTQKDKIRQIKYDNKHVNKKIMREIQMIFQDPVDSLDPRMTVEDIIQEGLIIQGHRNREENHKVVVKMLEKVGLVADHANRYPHEFSGGQRQRIGIARALVMNPKLLLCDEPISALDVSIRAQIINLLNELKEDLGLTMIFIAHDLSVVKYFCDRIGVMYFGKMVEQASSDELFKHPLHPYTKALLSAIPHPDPSSEKTRKRLIYNPAEAHDYSVDKPVFQEIVPGHFVYCNEAEKKAYLKEIEELDKKQENGEDISDIIQGYAKEVKEPQKEEKKTSTKKTSTKKTSKTTSTKKNTTKKSSTKKESK